jgi:hypothetical protein
LNLGILAKDIKKVSVGRTRLSVLFAGLKNESMENMASDIWSNI